MGKSDVINKNVEMEDNYIQSMTKAEKINACVFVFYFLAFTLAWYHSTRMMVIVNVVTFVILTGLNYKNIQKLFDKKYIVFFGFVGLQMYRLVLNQVLLGVSFRQEEKEIFWVLAPINTVLVLANVKSEIILKAIRDLGMCLGILGVLEVFFQRNPLNVLLHRDMDSSAMFQMEQLRCISIFTNPIIYATFIVIVWSIFLCYPYKNAQKNITMIVITLITILGTGSRSSWIPFFIITVLFCLQNYRKLKNVWLSIETGKKRILICVSTMVLILLGWWLTNKTMFILERFSFAHVFHGTAATIRKGNIVNILHAYITNGDMITRIFGTGMGGAATVVHNNPILGWDSVLDNQYLTFLYDYGVIGLLWLLVIGGVVFWGCWKDRKGPYSIVVMYVVIELAISMFFHEALEWGNIIIYTTMALVLYCKENRRVCEE